MINNQTFSVGQRVCTQYGPGIITGYGQHFSLYQLKLDPTPTHPQVTIVWMTPAQLMSEV